MGARLDRLISGHARYLALGRTADERQTAYRDLFRQQIDPSAISTMVARWQAPALSVADSGAMLVTGAVWCYLFLMSGKPRT